MQKPAPLQLPACFDRPVPPGGYAWWYVDALSDDGRQGLAFIAFVGSVFSPYYRRARARGMADPRDHCAVNLALYGDGPRRWTMTERSRDALCRAANEMAIGPSRLAQSDLGMCIALSETAVPLPRRVQGNLRVRYGSTFDRAFALDPGGRHLWRPIAPLAQIEVDLEKPRIRWKGSAYVDTNQGDTPLECDFAGWQWSRSTNPQDGTTVCYDVRRADGSSHYIGVRYSPEGRVVPIERMPWLRLPRTGWKLDRYTRSQNPDLRLEVDTLEDTPFYARSLLRTVDEGSVALTMHESLDLRRFRRTVVQLMLPFRMPRAG